MLENLRLIVLNERESGKLTQIPHETFSEAKKELEKLYCEVQRETPSIDRFFSGRPRDPAAELHSVMETLEEILTLRTHKILLLALYGQEKSDELKKMLPAERHLFQAVGGAIGRFRESQIGSFSAPSAGDAEEEEGEEKDRQAAGMQAESAVPTETESCAIGEGEDGVAYAIVRILEDIESFLGIDGRVYNLAKEDIVTLPESNAEVLCGRNIALNIRLSK
ncbi:MAG: DNA replication complex GINS family protein [Methanomicrobiales archaeon]|nr:DNA replication complex GINS family protein [Methanomicrobiales archaeon]